MRPLPVLLIASMGAALGGCSSFQPPRIEVQTLAITDTSPHAMVIEFEVLMSNPNSEPVELIEFNYTLAVDGSPVYTGRRDAQTTVPAGGQWVLTLPAVIPFSDVPWTTQTSPGQVSYELHGSLGYISSGALAEVLMDAGVYRPTTGFGAGGTLTLR